MEGHQEDDGWQVKKKKQRPAPAPVVEDHKSKSKNINNNNSRKKSGGGGGRNTELNQRVPTGGRDRDSTRDASSSASSTASTSTSSGRHRGGQASQDTAANRPPVTTKPQPVTTAAAAVSGPVPAPKSVWSKPPAVSAAPPVVDASDVSKKTNNVAPLAAPVKSAWGVPVTSAVPVTAEEKSAVFPVKPAATTVVEKPEPAKNSPAPSVTAAATTVTTTTGGWAAIAAKGATEKTTDVPPVKKVSTGSPAAETTKAPEPAPVAEKPAAVVDKPASPEKAAAPVVVKSEEVTPVKKSTGPQTPAKWAEAPEFTPSSAIKPTSSLPPPDVWVQAPVFTPSKPIIKSMPILPAVAAWAPPVTVAQPDVTQTVLAGEKSAVPSSSIPPLPKQSESQAAPETTPTATASNEGAAVTPEVKSSVPAVEKPVDAAAATVVEKIPVEETIASPPSTGNTSNDASKTKSDAISPSEVTSLPSVNGESSPDEPDKTPTKEDGLESSDKTSPENDSSTSSSKSGSQIKLKYNYKDDQWSPANLEGKKQYDRQFLLQLQTVPLSLEKPPNLPQMDIIKDKTNQTNKSPNATSPKDFMPGFIKSANQRSSISKKASRDASKRSNNANPKIIDLTLEKVELKTAENAWKPTNRKEATNGDISMDPTDILMRKARGILNKLCPQKFDILVEKFNDLQIDTEEKLRLCIELVFEKAVDEPGFSVAYARMCEVLQRKQVMVEVNVSSPGSGQTSAQMQPVNFRKLLITRCQKEFERDYMEGLDKEKYEADLLAAANDEAKKAELQADWADKEMRARRRSLGNIQFIGELYKLKMLTARIMHECIKKLLKSKDEESLESLSRLLTTVGKDLEAETNDKMKAAKSQEEVKNIGLAPLDFYFKDIEKLCDDKSLSSRVRFMLQDLVDLRRSGWKPRRDVAGPKTIDQIHKEAEREKTQQQLMNEMTGPRGGRDREMSGGHQNRGGKKSSRSGMPNQNQDDGWTNVQPPKARSSVTERIDHNKIANLAQRSGRGVDFDSMQLGPSRAPWGQGSGSQRLSRKEDQMPQVSNKFSMLNSGLSNFDGGYQDSSREPSEDRHDPRRAAGGPSRSMGPQRGPSMEAERTRALEDVRSHLKAHHQKDGGMVGGPSASLGPKAWNRPVPESMAQVNDVLEQTRQLRGKPDMKSDEVEKQSKSLMEEFLNNNSEKDAIEALCFTFHSSNMDLFVESSINWALDHSNAARTKVGPFLAQLVKRKILLKSQYEKGLQSVLQFAGDLIVDIPKIWDYLGQLIAPILVENLLPLTFIRNHNLAKDEDNFPGKYFAGVLRAVNALVGPEKLADMWTASNMRWEQFVNSEDIEEFVKSNSLEFTLTFKSELSPEGIRHELEKLLDKKPSVSSDEIIQWIEKELGDRKTEPFFIRILMTAVAENARKYTGDAFTEALHERKNILLHCLDGNVDREKEALYALQFLMHKLQHPNRELHQFFEFLYDNDVVSEEALFAWEKCENPAEAEGKGVAITSTTQFFSWLRLAEDEEEEDDEDEEGAKSKPPQ